MHLSHATSSSCTNYAKITLVIPVLSDLETWRQSYISLTTKVAIDDKLEEFERAWELLRGESRCGGGGGGRGDKEYQVKDYVVTFSGFYIRFSWKDFVKFDRHCSRNDNFRAWYSFPNFSQSQQQFDFLKLFRAKLFFHMPTNRNHILHSFVSCAVSMEFFSSRTLYETD